MSKKVRDYLLIIFIILFILLTVGISLYASGYKFNLSWPLKFNRLLQKTGMLAVATEPSRSLIYLNDKLQKDLSFKPWKKDYLLTPTKIKNILPGEYELRLEQAGYWPYKQRIFINSGETTFVEDVNLFKENIPLLILATPESDLALSPDKKHLYLQAAKKIITLKQPEQIRSLNFAEITNGLWLKNNKLLAAGIIFDPIKENGDVNYAVLIGAGATNWYLDESTGRLYYQNKSSLNRLDINKKTNSLLISGDDYLAFAPRGEKLFTVVKNENQIKLRAYLLKDSELESESILPSSGHYVFVNDIPNYLAVYDDQNKTLYLFNEDNLNNGPTVIRNIKNWAANDNYLVYTNDFEIYIFNLSNSRVDLVTRRSEEIDKIIWNTAGNYLIFSGPTTLNVLDFKNGNATLLFRAEKILSPVFDEKNNTLYFWAKIGEQSGVYKILLQ